MLEAPIYVVGALVHSACATMGREAFKAAGRNYHLEKLEAERERTRRYYIALYAEMERCRVAQVPMMFGAGLLDAGAFIRPPNAGSTYGFQSIPAPVA